MLVVADAAVVRELQAKLAFKVCTSVCMLLQLEPLHESGVDISSFQ